MTSCALWGMRKSGQNGGFRSTCAGDRGRLHVTGAQARSGEGTSGGEEGTKRKVQVAPPWAGKSLAPGQLRWALGQGDPKPCFLGEP